jgi:ammonia channel protein AmtB
MRTHLRVASFLYFTFCWILGYSCAFSEDIYKVTSSINRLNSNELLELLLATKLAINAVFNILVFTFERDYFIITYILGNRILSQLLECKIWRERVPGLQRVFKTGQ